MNGKRVKIIDGDFKGKIGLIIDVYEGWCFQKYTVVLDNTEEEIIVYHNEVELI
jgi:ribosomal protein L24